MSKKQQKKEEQEQEQVWTEIFNLFDKDKNGHICKNELGHVLRALDMDPSQKELDEAVKELDKDGNGTIEYADFRDYMLKMKRSSYDERKQEMMRAFRMMDKNNDKFIDSQELMSVLTSLGEPLTKEEVEAMIRVADVNKDGKIDYEEFVEFILAPFLQPGPSNLPSRSSLSTQQSYGPSQPGNLPMRHSDSSLPYRRVPTNQTMSSQSSTGFFYTADTKSSASSLSYQSQDQSMTSLNHQGICSNASMNSQVNLAMGEKDENDNEYLPNQNDIAAQKHETHSWTGNS